VFDDGSISFEKKDAKVNSKRANLTFNPSAESPKSTNISLHTPSFSKEIEPSSVHQITMPIERKLSFTDPLDDCYCQRIHSWFNHQPVTDIVSKFQT
jgi:hypothetical protein